jgi:hypothetical protein
MLSAASVACAPCRRLAWGDPAMTRLESNARSPPKRHAQGEPPVDPTSPDAMFKSEASSLKKSASAWWSHMRYILVAALAVSFALHHVAAAAEAKCSRGLDVALLDARGASEVTRKWHRCFVPNFDDEAFRPFDDWLMERVLHTTHAVVVQLEHGQRVLRHDPSVVRLERALSRRGR